jgi:hypothetical protein
MKLMKQQFLIIALLLFCTAAKSQVTVTPTVLAASGQYFHQGPLEISYTIGEMAAVTTVGSLSSVHITQGFHQPEEVGVLTALCEQKTADINFALFPNPTAQTVWLGYQMPQPGKVSGALYSVNGQYIQNLFTGYYSGGSNVDHYDVSKLSTGNYLLSLQFTADDGKQYLSTKEFSVTH